MVGICEKFELVGWRIERSLICCVGCEMFRVWGTITFCTFGLVALRARLDPPDV